MSALSKRDFRSLKLKEAEAAGEMWDRAFANIQNISHEQIAVTMGMLNKADFSVLNDQKPLVYERFEEDASLRRHREYLIAQFEHLTQKTLSQVLGSHEKRRRSNH